MSRNSRDDQGQGRRTPEQRERERLEREARRAGGRQGSERPAPAAPPPTSDLHDPPTSIDITLGGSRRRAEPAPAGQPPREPAARPGRRATRPVADEPLDLPRGAGAADRRRAARRRTPDAGGQREPPPLLRIQPEPPAPPALPAGALDDELDRPIGIRRVRHAVAQRTSPRRTIVTPPGDVPAGPARSRRTAGTRIRALVGLLVLAILIIGTLMVFQPFGSAQGAAVQVTIPPGSSAGDIGDQLADAGIVSSGTLFSLRATLAGKRGDLQSGTHTLHKDMTYGAAIAALSKKAKAVVLKTIKVTIPEGRSRAEIADLVRPDKLATSYLAASKRFSGRLNPFRYGAPKGTRSTEGFLFPATYDLRAGAPAKDLVDRQFKAFKDNFASVDLRRAHRKNLTDYDVLIIASMVEREAQLSSERAKIAAVIYNRLKQGVPLGIDATIRYATNNWTKPLTESALHIDSPYNTRTRKGLPPTPIGNPGLASIRAAAAPAHVSYLYYVVQPGTCGKHAFSSTFAQFEADSQRYNQARNAAGGKSPTTC